MLIEAALANFSAKFEHSRTRRLGSIRFRLSGKDGIDFYLDSHSTGCRVSDEPPESAPHVEVTGPADRIQAVLDGRKDGLLQFRAGGIRVRGDLEYLSELAHKMGFIRERF